jgi:hypothetical protein
MYVFRVDVSPRREQLSSALPSVEPGYEYASNLLIGEEGMMGNGMEWNGMEWRGAQRYSGSARSML